MQDRDLQSEWVLCSARGVLMMGRVLQCLGGPAMCGTLQFKEGSCFTVGVFAMCVWGSFNSRGPFLEGPFHAELVLEKEILKFMDAPEMQRKILGSSN